MGQRILFTVGHSTRPWPAFVELLKTWKIEVLVDVRSVPRSRAFPWFTQSLMKKALPQSGIDYVYLEKLGGFREPATDSTNAGWENIRFRAYADYMQTQTFEEGIQELEPHRKKRRTCVMCSEAVWWRCHRRMIADAYVARGIVVKHIMSEKLVTPHELTKFAVVREKKGRPPRITYP